MYSIVGFFFFGIILEPVAYFKARKAISLSKNLSQPPGMGSAKAAKIIATIYAVIIILAFLAGFLVPLLMEN